MVASMISYTKATPERTKRAPGDSDYCDHFAEFYLKNPDKMYMQFGSDGPNECKETYYRKMKEMKAAKEKQAEPYCAKVLPTKKFCAVNCANNSAFRMISVCLNYFPLCRPQLCGQCNKKFSFIDACKL